MLVFLEHLILTAILLLLVSNLVSGFYVRDFGSALVSGIRVQGFGSALVGSLVLTLLNLAVELLI